MENKTMNEMHGHGFSRGKERTLPRHEAHAASIRAERIDRASEHGRHFIRNNGTARAVYSSFAMNRKNKNGEWEPIRNGLTRTEHDYEASLGAFRTHFTPNTTARFCAEHNGASLNWEYVNAHAKPTLEVTEEIIPASGLGCGSRALYRDVDENVDIEYILLGDNLKENIIVKAPGGEYRYPFLLRTEGFEICPSKDNTSLFLYSAGNDTETPDFIIPAPYLLDAAGVRSNGAYYEFSPREDGSTDFTVVADAAWMNDPARVYPVTVDPQLITTNTMMFSIYTLRTTSPYYTSNGCDCSCEELTNVYRVGRNSNYEYSTHIGITKQMFHTYFGRILSAKFVMLVRSNENGNITIAEGYPASFTSDTYEIDVTSSFLNDAENWISITLSPTEERLAMMDVQFESSGANAPYLAIEYLLDENDAPIRKEFPLAGGGLGMLDINSGEFVPVFTDVPASRSLLGVEIAHVYKKSEDSLFVGDNFRLNLHEKLEKQKSTSPLDASYVYTDPMGDKHALTPHYYYRDANGVRSEVSANHVEIKTDGTLAYGSYGVTKEEHLSNGWKAMTQPEGVKNPELLDQRSEEQAKLEEQLESLEHTLKNLVRVDADSGEIKGRFANLTQKDYSNFIVKNANGKDDASKLYLPIDVAQSYQGLKAQIDALTIQDEAYQDQLINLETQKEALTIQLQTLEYQIGNEEEQSEASDSLKGSFETQKQALLAQEEALKLQQNSIFTQLHALDCQINDKNAEKKDAATCYEKIGNIENVESAEEFIYRQQYLNGLIWQEYKIYETSPNNNYYFLYCIAKLKSAIHEYNQLIEQYGILTEQIEIIRGQIQDLENQYECLCDQYDNLSKQLENLAQSGNSASSINEKNTIQQQKENCAEQKQIYEAQLEEIVNQASAYRKQFDKAIIAYVKTQAQLEEVYRHTPVNYVTNGTVVKGFNRNGELTVIYDAYENYVMLERDARHRITRLTDNNGNTVILRYYSRNRLSSITDAKGGKTTYHYTGERLTKIVSPDGAELKLTYENGNIASAEAESSISYLTYAGERLTEIRQCNKFASVAHGAVSGNVTEVSSTLMEYSVDWSDGLGLDSTSLTDETGKTEMYRFRSLGKPYDYRMLEFGKVVQAERYAEYYVNERGVETTPPSGVKCNRRKVTQAHENCLHVSASAFAFAEGDYEITALDSDNMPIWKETNQQTVSSACTKKYRTDYAYDDEKHLIRETLATDTKIGNTKTTATEVVIYTYDENGRCTRKEAYVEGEELKTGINIEEHVFNDKGVEIKSFTYNSLDPSSKFYTENEVDENGKVLCALDESGEHKTVFDYEHDGVTVKTERLPNGSKFSYGRDKDGTVTAITHSTEAGEENSTTQLRTLDMVTEVKSGNNTVQYSYDHKRRVKSVSLNGVEDYVTYSYSGEHTNAQKVTATMADGTIATTIKNAHGNVTKSTVGNKTVTNNYDVDQQLTKAVDSVSGETTLTYDDKGKVTAVTAPDHSEAFAYDEQDNALDSKTVTVNGITHTYEYGYKPTADKALDSISVDGKTVRPNTDALGRNIGKTIEIADNKIAEEKITYVKFGDHATNLPSNVRFATNGVFNESIQYKYDSMGNIIEVFENGRSACRYEYDALGRLTREDNVAFGKTTTWGYDNNGNIIARYEYAITAKPTSELHLLNGTCKLYTYADNSDQLVSFNGEEFIYDTIGNPTTYRGKAATWAYGRQLATYDGNTFAYDARGRRTAKNGITFTYDSNGNLIKQSNGLEFLYDHTGVFAVKHNGSTYFYRKDAQANIVALLDNTGATVVKYKYDAWGNGKVLNADGSMITDDTHIGILNPFRYRSYYFDTETNLYFLKTRYYDPEIGRFMTIDDISYLDPDSINGLNLYAYCGNNPINCIDPTGNAPWWSWLLSGLQLVGGIALCFVPGAQAIGVSMIVGGSLGLIANAVSPAIAQAIGGASSMANGWGAISTGISLLSFGTPGIIAGIGLMLVGGVTMAFGANEIAAAATGTNYIQEWTGMSNSAYGWTYFGLNVASSVGTSAGRWGMRVTATNIYNNTGEIKPYAVVSSDTKIVYYDGRGKMSWSTHLTNHGHPKQHPYVPHWHVELPHYPSGGFKNRYQLFWELILRSFGGGHR